MAVASRTCGSSFYASRRPLEREETHDGVLSKHASFGLCCFGVLKRKNKFSLSSAERMFVRTCQPFGGCEALSARMAQRYNMDLKETLPFKCHLQRSSALWPLHLSSRQVCVHSDPILEVGQETMAKDEAPSVEARAGIDVKCIPCDAHGGRADIQQVAKRSSILHLIRLVALVLPALLVGVLPAFATMKAATGGTSGAAVARAFASQRGSQIFASAWTGLIAGCLHTLTGPDHLAALAPLSIGRSKLQGALIGALWGCGHDAGQVLFGLLFILLKDKLHIDLIRTWGARVVGLTLLAIGVVGMREAQEASLPCLAGDGSHMVITESAESYTVLKKPFGLATFFTGVVHGLQPDALLVILPALALPSRLAGISFLSMFLVGTVVSMGSYTAFIGSCSEELNKRVPWITHRLAWGSSLIAIAVGISILLGELFGINLF